MDDVSTRNQEALDNMSVFNRALSDYSMVHIAVVYRPDVVLPAFLMTEKWKAGQDIVHLEYGLDVAIPITDLVVGDKGVSATLSFKREPHSTFIPWNSIVGFLCEGLKEKPPVSKPKLSLVR